ncbi:SNF-related serine/threonine-protein kinase [Trachymyrmex zeteki]|uniref:SNF-related serine/threonine-protein kinase n=1 Tax=Mycetomoellerius zeteki TaxID=64791 RepID=A0A151X1K1_9HYME|nr:PREDICTED: probable serine/threonine-protein kinase MARK-A [Trachymyrmex zeteki]XP_018305252.1 PREDICTED: probable serine/threonine-protein kinase MARK-A [Trachymyrmex zeteki]KYQ54279.1 SNF-related serine/threonine-protein kinase [Trachymyrmex zeteki]
MNRRVGYSNYDGKIAGLYDLEETLGRGHFAVVKLARHVFTGEKVAVKVIDKSKLDEVSRAHLFQEVRCMKLVQHPNVVRLYEVIDTQTKLYLILELGDGGDLYDYIMRHDSGLSEEVARTYFRQIVRAISYCHRLHVVHRDLKPENVVFFEKLGTVKLTDFGFSNRFCPGQKLETSCGSLAYSAPEILLGDSYDAPAVDVWSLGVILYMLVCGQAPFQEANDSETLTMIMDCKYSIPSHVSDGCKRLIARMLVREPEGRASLEEIAADPWLAIGSDLDTMETLPLVSRQQVSDDHHNHIITKMVNGNIATKEEILDALDKNEYNHITATYFLLAERKLRAHRQEQMQKNRPEALDVSSSRQDDLTTNLRTDENSLGTTNQSLLSVPRTPGDVPQNVRSRKCSIVQEEEDEDDVSSCSGRDERGSNSALNSLNRRGSRSEGKLSHILQERLSQLPEKHTSTKPVLSQRHPHQKEDTVIAESSHRGERLKQISKNEKDKISSPMHLKGTDKVQTGNVLLEKLPITPRITMTCEENLKNRLSGANSPSSGWTTRKATTTETKPKSVTECLKSTGPIPANKWRMGSQHHRFSMPLTESSSIIPSKPSDVSTTMTTMTTTKTLHESSTVSIPLHPISDNQVTLTPKYKTMPSPSGTSAKQPTLNEILEDGDGTQTSVNSTECGDSTTKCRVVRRTTYEQRKSKFHKTRTTSCSSSDASDDDSESRKKRAHKLGASTGKPLPPRRDSHDDSSDSQDPGGSGGGRGGVGGGGSGVSNGEHTTDTPTTTESNRNESGSGTNTTNTSTTNGGGRHRCTENQVMFGRRHRTGRRRAGETRLRESQSLNRITEVQEAEAPSSCHNHCHVSRNSTAIGTQNVSSSSASSVSQNNTASQHNVVPPVSQIATSTVQKAKGLGAKLLQSWSLSAGKSLISQGSRFVRSSDGKSNGCQRQSDDCQSVSDERRGDHKCASQATSNDKENRGNGSINECKNRKIRLLSRYFAVHKKLCVPLPGIFGKGRLYKARSCGSITRDRVSPPSPKSVLLVEDKWRERRQWCDAATKQHRGSDGDINQNLGLAHLVQENIVGKGCAGMPNVCHIHLGDASKCCSLC